jgi:diguanylate cyclase (GGDEF)-like protein/PAS domain S-box-containing protein
MERLSNMWANFIATSAVLLAAASAFLCAWLVRRESLRRRLAEDDAAESRARMAEMQELARIGDWEFDLVLDKIQWSEETFRIFGLPSGSQEPDFADVLLAIDVEDRAGFDGAIQRAIADREPYNLDLRIRTPEGTQKFIHAQGSAVPDAAGNAIRLIGTVLDITERKREENRLASAATHDALTGLANRRYFSSELEHEIRDARESSAPLAVCVCDIDRFKLINDGHGHGAGDQVIQALAQCLADGIRGVDLAARWGGDEFCLLLHGTDLPGAEICVERIRAQFQSLRFTARDGGEYGVTGSFGIAELAPGMSSAALLEEADQVLYRAKQAGRNRVALAASVPEPSPTAR